MPMPPSTGQADAGDEAGLVRAQEHRGVGDVGDLGELAERRLLHNRADGGVDVGRKSDLHDVIGELQAHVGRDQAGIDAIHPHPIAELAGFHRADPRHAIDGGFGAGVDGDARKGDRRRDRGDVDDCAALARGSARPHRAEGVLHAEHGADDVDVAHAARVLGLDLGDQRGDLDAGIVDQDVVAAQRFDRCGDGPLPLRVVGDVELDEAGFHPGLGDLGGAGLAGVVEDVADHDRGTGPRQRLRDCCANPPGAAGDQGFPAFKALRTHDVILPLLGD
ncbi:hypothetical protein ACVWY2_006396 [Bradyrhizobium sp. JR6.1]